MMSRLQTKMDVKDLDSESARRTMSAHGHVKKYRLM